MGGVSAALIRLHDLRDVSVGDLLPHLVDLWRQHGGPLLTVSRRPDKHWTRTIDFARPLILSSAPLYELVLWVDPEEEIVLPEDALQEQAALLGGYLALFSDESPVENYLELLDRHIESQDRGLYLQIARLAPLERALRELGYEHKGLKQGASALPQAIEKHRAGRLEKKARERLDLDFYHLLEHHLERERLALIPAWLVLSGSEDAG